MGGIRSCSVVLLVAYSIVASGLEAHVTSTSSGLRSQRLFSQWSRETPASSCFVQDVAPQKMLRLSGGGAQRGAPYALRQQKDALLKKILNAASIPDLLKIVQSEKLSVDHVGASFYLLAQLYDQGDASPADVKAVVVVLTDAAERRVLTLDSKAVSSILWSLGVISRGSKPVHVDSKLAKSLSARMFTEGMAEDFTSVEVANVLWGLSRLQTVDKPVLEAIMKRVASTAEQFNPKSIAHVLWAMATLKVKPTAALAKTLCQRGKQLAYAFDDDDVSDALWALQRLQVDGDVRSQLESALKQRGSKLTTANINEALQKLAASGVKADASAQPAFVPAPKTLSKNPFEQVVGNLAGFVQSLSKNLRGVGEQLKDPEALKAMTQEMNPEKLAAKLKEAVAAGSKAHSDAMEDLAARGKATASEFMAKDVVSMLQAVADSGAKSSAQLVEAMSRRGKQIADEFSPDQISAALAALGGVHGGNGAELLDALSRRGQEIAAEFTSTDVANTLQALAASGRKSGGQLLEAMSKRGQDLVGEFRPEELAKALEALAGVAGSKAGAELLEALSARGRALAGQLSASDAAAILAALAAKGGDDTRGLLEAVSARAQAVASEFEAEELSKALGAAAALGNLAASSALVASLVERGQVLAPTLDPQQLVSAFAALGQLGPDRKGAAQLKDALTQRARRMADKLSAQELANIMSVLERLGPDADSELVRLLGQRASTLTAKK